jgi:hypothetical protein
MKMREIINLLDEGRVSVRSPLYSFNVEVEVDPTPSGARQFMQAIWAAREMPGRGLFSLRGIGTSEHIYLWSIHDATHQMVRLAKHLVDGIDFYIIAANLPHKDAGVVRSGMRLTFGGGDPAVGRRVLEWFRS